MWLHRGVDRTIGPLPHGCGRSVAVARLTDRVSQPGTTPQPGVRVLASGSSTVTVIRGSWVHGTGALAPST